MGNVTQQVLGFALAQRVANGSRLVGELVSESLECPNKFFFAVRFLLYVFQGRAAEVLELATTVARNALVGEKGMNGRMELQFFACRMFPFKGLGCGLPDRGNLDILWY